MTTVSSSANAQAESAMIKLDAPVVVVPTQLSPRPMVDVMIGEHGPYHFILDTGARGALIDQALAEELGLSVVGQQRIGSPGGGGGVEVPIVEATSMRMGGAVWQQAELITFDFSGRFGDAFSGILGRELFDDVLLTLDYPEQQIRLEHGSLDASDAAVVSYTTAAPPLGQMRIDVDVAGMTIPFDLDTGSASAFTLPYHMRDRLSLQAEPVEVGQARLASRSATLWNAQLVGAIAFAGLSFDDPTITLIDLDFENGNLGSGFLQQTVLTIDQHNQRLRFDYQAPPASTEVQDGAAYAGTYGSRTITVENGALYIQRNDMRTGQTDAQGRRMQAPPFKLIPAGDDAFTLEKRPSMKVEFARDADGHVVALRILNQQGEWETAEREE